MKKFNLIVLIILVTACKDTKVKEADPCKVIDKKDEKPKIKCPDGSQHPLPKGPKGPRGEDGEDGKDGNDGKDGKDAVVKVIDPCGDYKKDGKKDEIVLKTNSGEFFSHVGKEGDDDHDDGKFLTKLREGRRYETADAQECMFKITDEGKYKELKN